MKINEYYKYFDLNPSTLKKLLEEYEMDSSIRAIKVVPEKWIKIASKYRGKKIPIEEESLSTASPKVILDNTTVIKDFTKLPEVLVDFKTEPILGYVKYVAEDKSHAFVRIIENFEETLSFNFNTDREKGVKVENFDTLHLTQIVQLKDISYKRSRVKKYKIDKEYFIGTISNINNELTFIEWNSFNKPYVFEKPIAILKDFSDGQLYRLRIFLGNRTFKFVVVQMELELYGFREKLKSQYEKIFETPELSSIDLVYATLAKTHLEDADDLLHQKLETQLREISNKNDKKEILDILAWWNNLFPKFIDYSKLKNNNLERILILCWIDKDLPTPFFQDYLIDILLLLEENGFSIPSNSEINFYHIEEFEIKLQSIITSLKIIDYRHYVKLAALIRKFESPNSGQLESKLTSILDDEGRYQLWKSDEKFPFERNFALKYFGDEPVKIQNRIIELVTEKDFRAIAPLVQDRSNLNFGRKLKASCIHLIQSIFNPVSFDLESDGQNVSEIAWNVDSDWNYFLDDAEAQIELFKTVCNSPENIIIGHNCLDFDIPILETFNCNIDLSIVWDTLRMETMLSPDLLSYSLVTSHKAKDDAELTLNLFYNQICRIVILEAEYRDEIIDCLPKHFKSKINLIWQDKLVRLLSNSQLEAEKNLYFKPEKFELGTLRDLKDLLDQSESLCTVIIAPLEIRKYILRTLPVVIYRLDNLPYDECLLNKNSIKNSDELSDWVKLSVLHFYNFCAKINIKPLLKNLSPYTYNKLQHEVLDISKYLETPDWDKESFLFVDPTSLNRNTFKELSIKPHQAILLYPDYVNNVQKELLRTLDLKELSSIGNENPIWMRFSGAQSYTVLSQKECNLLGIKEEANNERCWIKKSGFNTYEIYRKENITSKIKSTGIDSIVEVHPENNSIYNDSAHYVNFTLANNYGNYLEILNPDTLYRSSYWIAIKEIVKQIFEVNKHIVLLVNNKNEIQALQQYFRSEGYFVIDQNKFPRLSRRLEILHNSFSNNKLLIEPLDSLSAILEANYIRHLTICIDSFMLTENIFSSLKKSDIKEILADKFKTTTINDDDDTVIIDILDNKQISHNYYLGLQLYKSQIDFMRLLISDNDSKNILFFLDPRINDFPNLAKTWSLKNFKLNLWLSKVDYESELEKAEVFFAGPKKIDELPFSIEESKEILSNIFLPKECTWRPEQHEYLDWIIPGKLDVLVTLPTGGGKSLLFQAPALLRNMFTNRLSIVITPLKALMQDQVLALWDKGFFGNVEYLNSDRKSDAPIIYRSLFSGDISLLFITPERFRSRSFIKALESRIQKDGGLEYMIFDEAHCVSQWGHEFRPDYFNCAQQLKKVKRLSDNNTPLLLFSATVSEKIHEDFITIFND
ncbi:DEAD/DEAH box helicase [Nonlabens antarcticus]|uniref:DEAD/DEAH box helicase n=1 Tax=Nonlabens antarcticus TaxID=392714 RepID=UPI001890CADA|nr:DEAD/DEAH box helicase [Nonlabens antarcticus]